MRSPTPKYEIGDELWYVHSTGFHLVEKDSYNLRFKTERWEVKLVKISSITINANSVMYSATYHSYIGEDNLFQLKHQAVILATEKYNRSMEALVKVICDSYQQQTLKLVTPD